MKSASGYIFLLVLLISTSPAAAKRCTGSAYCTACSDCSQCKYCNAGGTCGVCSGKTTYDTPPEPEERNSYHEQHAAEYELPTDNAEQSSSINNLYDSPQASTTTHTTTAEKSPPYLWYLVVGVLLYLLFRRNRKG